MNKLSKDGNINYYIPFYIMSDGDIVTDSMSSFIMFKSGAKIELNYHHVCKIDEKKFAYFRLKKDAETAAAENDWEFIK